MNLTVRMLGVAVLALACTDTQSPPTPQQPQEASPPEAPIELREMKIKRRGGLGYILAEPEAEPDAGSELDAEAP